MAAVDRLDLSARHHLEVWLRLRFGSALFECCLQPGPQLNRKVQSSHDVAHMFFSLGGRHRKLRHALAVQHAIDDRIEIVWTGWTGVLDVASEVPEITDHVRNEALLTSRGKVLSGKHGGRLLRRG